MHASKSLLILAAIAPYSIWLIKFIMKQANSHVHRRNASNEELSKDDSSVSSSDPVACPFYPLTNTNDNREEELSLFDSDASSCGGPSPSTKYDVFLSFRGEDTRQNFTSHLHQALRDAGINAYIDYKLNKGEMIGPSLEKAIEDSHIFVIIFSENYASSTWCLDELVKIIECEKRDNARIIIPVFYHVEPSNVRKQSGSYADAFLKHERRFKDSKDQVQRWKEALSQIADLVGWDSKNIRPESELVKGVVKNISEKLICMSSCEFEGLVGIEKHVKEMEKRLSIGSRDVRIVGIWGMGGIGKTTIAEVVFHKLKAQFESYSFVIKVREQIEKKGLEQVQKECLSELLKDEGIDIYNWRSIFVKNRLRSKKILLVLDDVDNSIQADHLIKWVGPGSRIIITSRDKHVIKVAGAKDQETYHVQEMNYHDAFQLFSLKAFKKNQPPKNYFELSKIVVNYCQGIPLALIVLGSLLFKRSVKYWESALENLEKAPDENILNVIKISFDGLNDAQKNIFFDLSCFFSKSKRNMPKRSDMRNYYEPSPDLDIEVLIERSLISVDEYGRIVMHDLVVAMGQEISSQLLASNPDKPIRLWKHEDVYCALTEDMGTKTIRSISMDISTEMIRLQPTTFQKMYRLRYLQLYNSYIQGFSKLHVPEDLQNLPKELRHLHWDEYPLPSLPSCPKNLVMLKMRDSHLKHLWDGILKLPNLKEIDLSGSENLIELPDLSQTNIKSLNLDSCKSLVRLHSSSSPVELRFVNWMRCPLQSLPLGIISKNLVGLWLTNSNLEYLWDEDQHLPNLRVVYLTGSKKLIALPDLCQAPNIEMLDLAYCPNLVRVYSSSFLYNLHRIRVIECPKLRSLQLPRDIQRRCSLLLAVCYYFDIHNFSFLKVTVSLFVRNENNTSVLRLKAVPISFTEISECMDGVSSAELQVLRETLLSSLPNLKGLGWLHIPSPIGQFGQQFEVQLSLGGFHYISELCVERKSTKNWNPEKEQQSKEYPHFPCMKGMAIKEASSPSEQLMGFENSITGPDFHGFNRLLKVPNNMGLHLSDITKLSLQRSDIMSIHASSIPGLSSLISLTSLCDCKSHRTILDFSVVQTSKEEGFIEVDCGNGRTWFTLSVLVGPTSMRMNISNY